MVAARSTCDQVIALSSEVASQTTRPRPWRCFSKKATGFQPAEDFFQPFSQALTECVNGPPGGGSAIDGGATALSAI